MGFNHVRAMWAQVVASAEDALSRVGRMPEHIAVTKAGFAGRVHAFPNGLLDTGFIQPEMYDDGEDHETARKRYEPVDDTPHLHRFARQSDVNPVWKSAQPEKVDLRQPIYATQPHVLKQHVQRYLANPKAKTHFEETSEYPEMAKSYPFTESPGFVKYRGRMHVVDGHHRVAAALMRGDSHIPGKVWDADQYGLPLVNVSEHGWGDKDPGPPRDQVA